MFMHILFKTFWTDLKCHMFKFPYLLHYFVQQPVPKLFTFKNYQKCINHDHFQSFVIYRQFCVLLGCITKSTCRSTTNPSALSSSKNDSLGDPGSSWHRLNDSSYWGTKSGFPGLQFRRRWIYETSSPRQSETGLIAQD